MGTDIGNRTSLNSFILLLQLTSPPLGLLELKLSKYETLNFDKIKLCHVCCKSTRLL